MTICKFKSIYMVNGNTIGISIFDNKYANNYKDKFLLRNKLSKWGKANYMDSIVLLHEDDNKGVFMDVFEPNEESNETIGSWSTMCGNGLLALGVWLKKTNSTQKNFKVSTNSGIREIFVNNKYQVSVNMGKLFSKSTDLHNYVNFSSINSFLDELNFSYSSLSYGFTGDLLSKNKIDGEPHLVFILKENQKLENTYKIALNHGTSITNNSLVFPNKINTNFVSVQNIDTRNKIVKYNISTYERGLGNDPKRSITKSCGTGATTSFGLLLRELNLNGDWFGEAISLGGTTNITKKGQDYFLKGEPIENTTISAYT